jgi:hypothetical protein
MARIYVRNFYQRAPLLWIVPEDGFRDWSNPRLASMTGITGMTAPSCPCLSRIDQYVEACGTLSQAEEAIMNKVYKIEDMIWAIMISDV